MGERRLASYLVLPRHVNASMLVAGGYIVARLGGGGEGAASLAVAMAAWLAFDLGLYQARYLLNDLLDADVDRAHPGARERGRLPSRPDVRRWVAAVLGLRVVLSVAVIALLPGRARPVTVVAVVALAGVTLAYECARTLVRRRPVRLDRPVAPTFRELAVYAMVGSGYGLRFGFGLALGGGHGGEVVTAVVFGWVFGELLIAMAYILDVAYLWATGGTSVLERKSHLAVVSRLLPDDPTCREHPLWCGSAARLTAGLLAATSALAVAVGARLGGWPGAGRLALLLLVCAAVSPLALLLGHRAWAGLVPVALDVAAALALVPAGGRDEMVFLLLVVTLSVANIWSLTLSRFGVAPEPSPVNDRLVL